jgi:signal transduction histidine kinase
MEAMSVNRKYFRISGLAVWIILALSQVAQDAALGESIWPPAVGVVLFAAAFWHNTHPHGNRAWRYRSICFILLQLLGASFLAADGAILVAMQLPFVFAHPARVRWLLGQIAWIAFLGWLAYTTGDFHPTSGYEALPWFVQALITVTQLTIWQAFAFFAAVVLQAAEQSSHELALRNGEILAAQTLLAESTRIGERLRIARDLHDSAGHLLTALSVNLQLASRLVEGAGAEQVVRAHFVARTLLAEVREVVGAMRDEAAIDLSTAVRQLTASVLHPAIHLKMAEPLHMPDPLRAHTLFRCIQEILTNAIRHANSRNLWLSVTQSDGKITLESRDDGQGSRGFAEGNGLRGMRERLEECGGWLVVEAAHGSGFVHRIELPLQKVSQ